MLLWIRRNRLQSFGRRYNTKSKSKFIIIILILNLIYSKPTNLLIIYFNCLYSRPSNRIHLYIYILWFLVSVEMLYRFGYLCFCLDSVKASTLSASSSYKCIFSSSFPFSFDLLHTKFTSSDDQFAIFVHEYFKIYSKLTRTNFIWATLIAIIS